MFRLRNNKIKIIFMVFKHEFLSGGLNVNKEHCFYSTKGNNARFVRSTYLHNIHSSAGPGEMPHSVSFHPVHHCLLMVSYGSLGVRKCSTKGRRRGSRMFVREGVHKFRFVSI